MTDKMKIESLIEKIEAIIESCLELKSKLSFLTEDIHPTYRKSASNLIYYLALRKNDIRAIQEELAELGVSSIGRPESHVMANLLAVNKLLYLLADLTFAPPIEELITIKEGSRLLEEHANLLFGKSAVAGKVRVMVTLPTESSNNYELVEKLLEHGADCFRINCAHDDERIWLSMIENVRKSAISQNKVCSVFMDLGGPKLRTGTISQGKKVLKLRPTKNKFGEVLAPFIVNIVSSKVHKQTFTNGKLVVEDDFYKNLYKGAKIKFVDARGSKRNLIVEEVGENEIFASLDRTAYFTEDTILNLKTKSFVIKSRVLDFPYVESAIVLSKGDVLVLHLSNQEGENGFVNEDGNKVAAHVSCAVPEVYNSVKVGEKVKFDDGVIEGMVQKITKIDMTIIITHCKPNGGLLKADKSINFPDSSLKLNGLTTKDKEDLEFIAKHADAVNMSFVNRPEDVDELLNELKQLNASHIGISLKIETQEGFKNLPFIILKAMKHCPIGIFIARGDLAVEAGWERMAELQEEILWICEAAHLPNIWGTQVLENMIKTGIPSRAEITDAAMAQRAECVMLNKGKYAIETIEMLNNILNRMHEHQYKKTSRLRKLQITELI